MSQVGSGGKARTVRDDDGRVTAIAYYDGEHVIYELFDTPVRGLPDVAEWSNFNGRRVPMLPKRSEEVRL